MDNRTLVNNFKKPVVNAANDIQTDTVSADNVALLNRKTRFMHKAARIDEVQARIDALTLWN